MGYVSIPFQAFYRGLSFYIPIPTFCSYYGQTPEPGGTTVESAQIDLRAGGGYRIKITDPQRNLTIIIAGTYREVNIPRHRVCTWTWQEVDVSTPGDFWLRTTLGVPAC